MRRWCEPDDGGEPVPSREEGQVAAASGEELGVEERSDAGLVYGGRGSARPRSQRVVAPGGRGRFVLNRIGAGVPGFSGPARAREPVGRCDRHHGAERHRCHAGGARSGTPTGPHGSDEARERVCRPPSRENAAGLVYLCRPMGRRWARRPALPIGVTVRAAAERRCLTGQGARPCASTPRLRHVGAARSSQT